MEIDLKIKVFGLAFVALIIMFATFRKYWIEARGKELPDEVVAVIYGDSLQNVPIKKMLFGSQWWFAAPASCFPLDMRIFQRIESGINDYATTLWKIYFDGQWHFGVPAKNLYFENPVKIDERNNDYIGVGRAEYS